MNEEKFREAVGRWLADPKSALRNPSPFNLARFRRELLSLENMYNDKGRVSESKFSKRNGRKL